MGVKKITDDNGSRLIAENLSILIKKNKLNVSQLANILGIPMMTIRRLISGETEDPRISTLKLISDYFGVSLDLLVSNTEKNRLISSKKIKSYLIPKLSWEILKKLNEPETFENWTEWQTFSLGSNIIGSKAFALESRPSMYPRFPKGTIFILDPEITPADGDIVLVRLKKNNEFTLRELIIDPPVWKLDPLVPNSDSIVFSCDNHEIIAVSLLTMLYNSKLDI